MQRGHITLRRVSEKLQVLRANGIPYSEEERVSLPQGKRGTRAFTDISSKRYKMARVEETRWGAT